MLLPESLRTDRLVLRRWRAEDRAPFAALNADPVVMEHYPALLSTEESNAFVDRIEATFAAEQLGLWAIEVRATAAFIGYVGLWPAMFTAPFTPAVEIGWRLAAGAWGQGYAPEAARVAIRDGFERLGLAEIVSFTSALNERSQRVMQKLDMARHPAEDFDHPNLPEGHRLRRHVLYRLPRT